MITRTENQCFETVDLEKNKGHPLLILNIKK